MSSAKGEPMTELREPTITREALMQALGYMSAESIAMARMMAIYRLALRALDLEAQMQKHDCLAWHNEGVGCANCVKTIYPDASKSLRDAKEGR